MTEIWSRSPSHCLHVLEMKTLPRRVNSMLNPIYVEQKVPHHQLYSVTV